MIVLAAPAPADSYYRHCRQAILDTIIALIRAALAHDEEIYVFAHGAAAGYLRKEIPEGCIIPFPAGDIWLRDYAPIVGGRTCEFRYRPWYAAEDGRTSRAVRYGAVTQVGLRNFFKSCGIESAHRSDLVLDGGSFLYNRGGRGSRIGLLSHRFCKDNGRGRTNLDLVKEQLDLDRLVVIAEPGDVTGHIDGCFQFLDTDHLFIQDVCPQGMAPADSRSRIVRISEHLKEALPEVRQTVFTSPVVTGAVGLYANCIVTEKTVFLPNYGLGSDERAWATLRDVTDRAIVSVDAIAPAILGGSLHCLSWQPDGLTASRIRSSLALMKHQIRSEKTQKGADH